MPRAFLFDAFRVVHRPFVLKCMHGPRAGFMTGPVTLALMGQVPQPLHCCRSLRRLGSHQRVEFSPSNSRLIDPTADIFFGVPTVLERSRDSMISPHSIKKDETRLAY